jgi:hypothetical protein
MYFKYRPIDHYKCIPKRFDIHKHFNYDAHVIMREHNDDDFEVSCGIKLNGKTGN